MEDITEGHRVQLAASLTLLAMVAGATINDLVNNFAYGWAISGTAALTMVIAALAVPAIPAVAKKRGWCWLKRAAAAAAVVMTVYCAWNAYSVGQANTSLASQTVNQNYEKAKAKEKRANEVLSNIKELGTVAELGTMAVQADARLTEASKTLADAGKASEKACKKPLSDACTLANADRKVAETGKTLAEREAKLAHERASQAEARDEAKRELAEAEALTRSGKTAERKESEILTALSILLTQLVALLSGEAFAMTGGALKARRVAREAAVAPRPRKAPATANPMGGERLPSAANVIPLNLRRHGVEAWLRTATKRGGELKGGEAFKAYQRWPEADKTMTAPELRAILASIYGEALAPKNSGYVVRGISLRTAAASEPRTAAAR